MLITGSDDGASLFEFCELFSDAAEWQAGVHGVPSYGQHAFRYASLHDVHDETPALLFVLFDGAPSRALQNVWRERDGDHLLRLKRCRVGRRSPVLLRE